MKKAFKISAVLLALVIVAALTVAFSVGAAPTDLDGTNFRTEIKKGGEFKLTEDIGSLTDTEVIYIGENVVLDLNGHTISSGVTGGLFIQSGVANPGDIIITDSVGGGAIIAPDATLFDNTAGTVKIQGGTIVAAGLLTDTCTCTATVQGSGKAGDGATKATWTSFDPSSYLVWGYDKVSEASPASADAGFRSIPKEYTITYELPNGAVHTNPSVYDIETPDISLDYAAAPGYDFVGWYIKEDGAEQKVSTIVTATHLYDITIVGRFTPKTYKINYNLDDTMTNAVSNPSTFDVTMADVKLATPTKLGAKFIGWFDAPTGGNRVESIACSTTYNDVNVYPVFELINYNITYVLYNGSVADGNPATYTVDDAITFNPASKIGYTFDGWYDDAVEGNAVTGIEAGSTGDVIVYARYATIEYTITYNLSGVDVTNEASFPTSYNYETPTFALPVPETAPGQTFTGWVDADGNTVSIIEVGSYGNVELTATWQKTQYKLFYYFGIGVSTSSVNNTANTTEYFTYDQTVILKPASRAYYDFAGWFNADPADPSATELEKDADGNWIIPANTTNNVTVYAKWTPTEYTITYDEDGYMWELDKDDEGNYKFDAADNFIFKLDTAGDKIKIMLDDTAVLENAPATYTWPAGVTIPSPVRVGFDFVGWYDTVTETLLTPNADGNVVIAPESRNGNMSLVAEWTVGRYDVTIQYQYNDDYYAANKELIDSLPNGRIFWEEKLNVVYDTNPVHTVDFTAYNGFVPAAWTVTITNEDMLAGEPIIVYFEPVVLSTTYADGKLVVTYYDGSKKSVDISSLSSVKLQDNALIYVTADGSETQVASIPTQADFVALQNTVTELNNALTTLKTNLEKTISDNNDALTAEINSLKASIATNLSKIEQNTASISDLESQIAELQAQIDALDSTDGTLLALAIIAAVLAFIAVVGVVVLFVKKK